ncbi:cation-translocating P-type ATPase [Flavobacterium subsaxonicum]|uniref:ATPase n=1 Tax=Flavobacterium subsaxonicum WB 4.1-42 = DSM 21790 TaxID=1121898 RepID=A0A0A2MQX2_9FLAO|nr:cation-translocating P-type ATPase [Flavobacterium subsaxonicum]KGO95077.1 ATPase [Flavobacterium subsaxonicum WB 4.1-42 = DSM 21790]
MWFDKSVSEILEEFHVNPATGLTGAAIPGLQEKYGPNELTARDRKSIFILFLSQLKDWLIYILLAAVIITIFMGEYIDAAIIATVIILNAVIGLVQEVKAGNAIEALKTIISHKAIVKRDGAITEIEATALVPGDIVLLDAGRYVPADLRLLESAELKVDESALTGESLPATKDAKANLTDANTPLGEQSNVLFMSTLVTSGRGVGVVVATGMKTELGKIAGLISNQDPYKTPLELRLDRLGKTLGKIAIGICAFIFAVSYFQGRNILDMFLLSISLAVASIPEGLTAIVAIVLSLGVTRMSKKNAIIRRLAAVETLGSVTNICTDKTGTLTLNQMTVTEFYCLDGKTVSGTATYSDTNSKKLLCTAMILCSDATYENSHGTGDPTEIALLKWGNEMGIDSTALRKNNTRVAELPFDSDRKLMSVVTEEGDKFTVYTKGAIGSLLKVCTHVLEDGKLAPLTSGLQDQFRKITSAMSSKALRTLGAAYKHAERIPTMEGMENSLVLIGLVGMIDPPRKEAKESIQKAKNAGIITIMITGDHKETAFAIAHEMGIAERLDQAITGPEIDSLSAADFARTVSNYRVFARVSPEHKINIVCSLKAKGNIVSMTGDGVNDAPSLKAADIGVAMGITGTDVAKEAADMILTDDNFATIVVAVEQGRNIYNNIKKSVIFLLSCNLGEVVTMFVCLLLGWDAPLIATQLLWINLLTDSLPAIALGIDTPDPGVMKQKPRSPMESFFSDGAGLRTIIGGLLIGAVTITAFWYGHYEHGYSPLDESIPKSTLEYARSMAFMVLVVAQLLYALAMRKRHKTIIEVGFFSNKFLLGAIFFGLAMQMMLISIPFMQKAFNLQPLDGCGWAMVSFLGLLPLLVKELYKIFARAFDKG